MSLFGLVQPELDAVDRLIREVLTEEDPMVQRVADYLQQAPGKRVRPGLVLLGGHAARPEPETARLVPIAAAVELIHLATLVHDDIIDRAETRRGQPALHRAFNDQVAVLTGDFLFARAFQLLAGTGHPDVVAEAANVVHTMCVGEIRQNLDHGRVATEAEYLRRIDAKTAQFLATSCRLGALAVDAPAAVREALTAYGWHIGMAYQLVDDLLDVVADPIKLGKAVATDFQQGVITLPVLYGLERVEKPAVLEAALAEAQDPRRHAEAVRLLTETGALDDVRALAERMAAEAVRALDPVPAGPAREALVVLARFVVVRDF